jgi:hypothetical protein
MNREQDFRRFAELLIGIGKATPQGAPDPQKIEGYFQLLEDMDFETIKSNTIQAVRIKGFFPMVSEIRREDDKRKKIEAEADRAYRLIEWLLEKYYYPGFGESSMAIIDKTIEQWERDNAEIRELHLPELLRRWGAEIFSQQNPSATRAQFLKSFQIECGHYQQLSQHEQTEISDNVVKLLDNFIQKD